MLIMNFEVICRQHKKMAFEVFFNELISKSSAGIAIQSNNAKDCNFFHKKKKAGVLREIFENLLRYKNCTCTVYNIVLV